MFYKKLIFSFIGLHARLGEKTRINVTILANEYPSGLFAVNESQSSRYLSEDYDAGHKAMTTGSFYVTRSMGALFNVNVSKQKY